MSNSTCAVRENHESKVISAGKTVSDVDGLLDHINLYEEILLERSKNESHLISQLQLSTSRLKSNQKKQLQSVKDLSSMRELLTSSLDMFSKKNDKEDENRRLMADNENLRQQITEMETRHVADIEDMERRVQELVRSHTREMDSMRKSAADEYERSQAEMKDQLKETERQLEEANAQYLDLEQHRQMEIALLTAEKDNKISNLQRQLAAATAQSNQLLSGNQDIFRKKLQHVQADSEHQISSLKETIARLEQQLELALSASSSSATNHFPNSTRSDRGRQPTSVGLSNRRFHRM